MAVVEWIGSIGPWINAGFWSGGSVPTLADDVKLDAGDNVTNTSAAFARSLDLFDNAFLVSEVSLTVENEIRIGFDGIGTSRLLVRGGTLSALDINVGVSTAGLLVVSDGSTVSGRVNVGIGSVIVGGMVPDVAGTILGNIDLLNGATSLVFRTTNDAAYGGNVFGSGSILIDSAGQVTRLTGDNSGHSGTTTIQAGTLQIGDGGTTGTLGTGNVVNNGTLAFQHGSGQYTNTNAISGSGNLVVRGTGVEILTGNNSYSGTTQVESGFLVVGLFGPSGKLGTGDVTIAAGAFLELIC